MSREKSTNEFAGQLALGPTLVAQAGRCTEARSACIQFHDTARDPRSAVAARIGALIVGSGVQHECAPVGVEQRGGTVAERDTIRRRVQGPASVSGDDDHREIAGVRSLGRVEAMMTGIGFEEELLQEAAQKGASGYVSKTAPLDNFLMEVHRTLNYKQ